MQQYTVSKNSSKYIVEVLDNKTAKAHHRRVPLINIVQFCGVIENISDSIAGNDNSKYRVFQVDSLRDKIAQNTIRYDVGISFANKASYHENDLYSALFQGGRFKRLYWSKFYYPLKVLLYLNVVKLEGIKNRYMIIDIARFNRFYKQIKISSSV
jgi:hypothetical protein